MGYFRVPADPHPYDAKRSPLERLAAKALSCAMQHVRHMQRSCALHCLAILALVRRCELVLDIVFVQSLTPNKKDCLEMS